MLRAASVGFCGFGRCREMREHLKFRDQGNLTMRLSDAGLRRRPTKLIYPHHRLPPWLTEYATPRSLEPIVRLYCKCVAVGKAPSRTLTRAITNGEQNHMIAAVTQNEYGASKNNQGTIAANALTKNIMAMSWK